MAYDALGNYVPDDAVSVDDMRHELLAKNKINQFIKNLEAMYQLLPGSVASRSTAQGVKPIAETVATVGSGLAAPFLGVAKGIGQNILNNTNERVDRPELAEAFTYQPRTRVGQNYVESIMGALDTSKVPPYIAHAGQFRFTPDDLRVAGKTAVSDVRNFPMDFANARAGFQREYPTLGSTAAGAVQRAEPLLEKGLSMYESGQLTPGFNPVSEAVKPKGGNWPTSLAGDNLSLGAQGEIGAYLKKSEVDPITLWYNNLPAIKKREFSHFFQDTTGMPFDNFQSMPNQFIEDANAFVNEHNQKRQNLLDLNPGALIKPVGEFTDMANAYNDWIAGPHKKYILNQMGTGVETDPVLKLVDEYNMALGENKYIDPEYYANRGAEKRDTALDTINRHRELGELMPDKYSQIPTAGYENVGVQTARTPEGQLLENLQDWGLRNYSWRYNPTSSYTETFPHLAKLKENTPVYDVLSPDSLNSAGLKDIKQQVIKSLMSGEIAPENLKNKSVESIARDIIKTKTDELKRIQKDKNLLNAWKKQNYENLPAEKTLEFTDADGNPSGVKIVTLDKELYDVNPDLVERNMALACKDLDHCLVRVGHNTKYYPNAHEPHMEPHTGMHISGSPKKEPDTVYLNQLKNGRKEYPQVLDKNGNVQASLETRTDKKHLDGIAKNHLVQVWLEDNQRQYMNTYWYNEATHGRNVAIDEAINAFPEIGELIKEREQGLITVDQIKGYQDRQVKPEYVPYIKSWLNLNSERISDVPRDLQNLPGVLDLREFTPAKLADMYPSLSEDKLTHMFYELAARQEQLNPTLWENYNNGFVENWQMHKDVLPRFTTIDEIRQVAEQNGFDISKDAVKQNPNGLSISTKLGLESMMDEYFMHGYPRDIEDYHDNFQRDFNILVGDQSLEGVLPAEEHKVLTNLLLNQEENKNSIMALLNDREQEMPGWTDQQKQNMKNIIENWLQIHPFEE